MVDTASRAAPERARGKSLVEAAATRRAIVAALGVALGGRDRTTQAHCRRVALYAVALGAQTRTAHRRRVRDRPAPSSLGS